MPAAEHQKLESRTSPHRWRDWACGGRCGELCPISAFTAGSARLCVTDMDRGGSSWAGCAWDEITLPGTQKCKQRCVVGAHVSSWLLSLARWGPTLRTCSGTQWGTDGTAGISSTLSATYRGIATTRAAERAAWVLCRGSQPSPGICRDALCRPGFVSATTPLHPWALRPSDALQRAEPPGLGPRPALCRRRGGPPVC